MIDARIEISCDGEHDGDMCPATFTVENYGGGYISPLRVANELAERGWQTWRPSVQGADHQVFCPLHHARRQDNDR